jgi:catechol 2,3-dioxygenase-like lactoylglutathione lyase family enzyme
MNMPPVGRIVETSLYVDPLERSIEFYERVFGFPKLASDSRFCAFNVSGQQVLLLFRKGASLEPLHIPGGIIPPSGGDGSMHLAFTIQASDEDHWRSWLEQNHVAIESRVSWPLGGASLYFRDPDGHLLELITPGCWTVY